MFLIVLKKLVSSVNIIGSSDLVEFFKSFINKRKSNGSSMQPCRTPHRKTSKSVLWLQHSINCFPFVK